MSAPTRGLSDGERNAGRGGGKVRETMFGEGRTKEGSQGAEVNVKCINTLFSHDLSPEQPSSARPAWPRPPSPGESAFCSGVGVHTALSKIRTRVSPSHHS